MGVFDDAIREHLELKRRHGVPEKELKEKEEEAFGRGAPRRATSAAAEESAADEQAVVSGVEADEVVETELVNEGAGGHEADLALEEPQLHDEVGERIEEEPGEDVEAPYLENDEAVLQEGEELPRSADIHPEELPHHEDEAHSDLVQDTVEVSKLDEGGEEPIYEPEDKRDEPETSEEDEPETSEEDEPETSEEDEPETSEDVLEETPEFLEETPEHDRLWFEQKPPKEFDFDE